MSIYKIVDSNIVLDFPQIIERENNLIISTDVLRELDGLKKHSNREVAFKARRAAITISKHIDSLKFDSSLDKEMLPVDDKLLELTKSYAGTLITNDVYLKIKAIQAGLQTSGYGGIEDYSGVITWVVDFDENGYNAPLEELLTTYLPPKQFEMKENQYLIVKDGRDNEVLDIWCWRKGTLEKVMYHEIRNKWTGKIKPRPNNPEQVCLCDLLAHPEITICYAGGGQGKGKSFLMNNYALQQLEHGDIRKIIYIPNNAYVENSMDIGAIPGTSFEKTSPLIGPLIDLIGIDEVMRLMADEMLEVIPLAYLRGRNFDDSIIIVNEAQNLDANHVKLLIGRVGNNSRIFFDGSLQQIDSQLFKDKNGIRNILKLADSPYSELFGTVRLEKVERSRTAQVADYLDEIGGF